MSTRPIRLETTGIHASVEMPELPLDRDFIARTLDLYNPEHVSVVSATLHGSVLNAVIRPLLYPFTKPGHISYVTASMAFLYLSQASYLAVRSLILRQPKEATIVTDEDFFAGSHRGELVFSSASLRFKRKIWIAEGITFPLKVDIRDTRVMRSHLFAGLLSDMDNGALVASGMLAMPISLNHTA
ncbi:hypothetical protein MUP01_01445 [Candidatus Bathyarchaeota archaeon]|nr:hypothetical protein [Candidatus Bathyarchaeota archaeon]